MAAFSSIFQQPQPQQPQPFLLDPNSHPNSATTINYNNVCSALLEQPNDANLISTSSFYHIQPHQNLDHNNNNNNDPSSDHLLTLTNNKNTTIDSSSIVTHHHNLVTTSMDKKRKATKHLSNAPNSAQSKDIIKREVKAGKKQKKMKDNIIGDENKEEEEKKAEAGYIHVRARRGQATDSHSLAERVRRERISERMKLLQGLVPGCDKVTGKALMLDEIINYVQSLQNQVEFLSMKLASVNPTFYDFGVDLESLMARPHDQDLSNLASPLTSSSPTTANNYHNLLENPTNSILFPQNQIFPNALPQQLGSRQGLWEVDEHRQRIINQSGLFTNTFFSFH